MTSIEFFLCITSLMLLHAVADESRNFRIPKHQRLGSTDLSHFLRVAKASPRLNVDCSPTVQCPDGNTCCPDSAGSHGCCEYSEGVCCFETVGRDTCCPQGSQCCADPTAGCCSVSDACCIDGGCCSTREACCGQYCCATGSSCCGVNFCCGGECCPDLTCCPNPGERCCGDFCCSPNTKCCDQVDSPGCCPNADDVCCNGGICCPSGTTCCVGGCCLLDATTRVNKLLTGTRMLDRKMKASKTEM